jgi:hypothetical protein
MVRKYIYYQRAAVARDKAHAVVQKTLLRNNISINTIVRNRRAILKKRRIYYE